MKFQNAYEQYLIFIENKQKEQSKATLKERFNNHILPYFKDYDIYKISENDYLLWQHEINKMQYSNNFKKNLHYLMSGFFEYLIRYYKIDSNIPKRVGQFQENIENKIHHTYTPKELKKFIRYLENDIYKTFFTFMYFTGTRPGETMAITFQDLQDHTISINKTISEHYIDGKRVIGTPKTKSSNRTIPLDRKLYKSLLKLKKYYQQENSNFNENFYIFGGFKPLAPTTINRYKNKACIKANLTPLKLHEFRHSHATLLYDRNIPVQSIKERLGHSSTNTTLGTYIHLTKRQEKRVLRTLNFLRMI